MSDPRSDHAAADTTPADTTPADTSPGADDLGSIRVATSLLAAAAVTSRSVPVPACPGWTIADLAAHLGQVQRWATAIVGAGHAERPGPASAFAAPTEACDITDWLLAGVEPLITALLAAGTDSPAWNFARRPAVSAFWWRRQSCEAWIHAADAAEAQGQANPIPPRSGVTIVDEFLTLLPGGKLARLADASIGGSLHLHATDPGLGGAGEWMLELDGGRLSVAHGHGKGAAALRAPAAELAAWVWGRRDAVNGSGPFEIFGDAAVVRAWQAIGAF